MIYSWSLQKLIDYTEKENKKAHFMYIIIAYLKRWHRSNSLKGDKRRNRSIQGKLVKVIVINI